MLSVTVLMDNSPSANRALLSGHGLSLLVEGNGCRILFDCGPDDRFMQNARKLGIPLSGLDAAVLSHGHYDHAAGLRDLAEEGTASFPPLYVGRGFFRKKHSRSGLRFSDLSPGWTRQDAASWGFSIHEAGGCLEIAPGIFLIQGFPARFHPHFLNRFISQLLHMERVRHTTCGRKADTCCLFHVRRHVKGYFPDLEASEPGKL